MSSPPQRSEADRLMSNFLWLQWYDAWVHFTNDRRGVQFVTQDQAQNTLDSLAMFRRWKHMVDVDCGASYISSTPADRLATDIEERALDAIRRYNWRPRFTFYKDPRFGGGSEEVSQASGGARAEPDA